MPMQNEMIVILQKTVQDRFPEYPVQVRPSMDGPETLCVYVFCVDKLNVKKVEKDIFGLQVELCPGEEFLFLPMVKTLDITRQYYPEMMERYQSQVHLGKIVTWLHAQRSEWIPCKPSRDEFILFFLRSRSSIFRNSIFEGVLQKSLLDFVKNPLANVDLLPAITTGMIEPKVEKTVDRVDAETGFNLAA
ncbi:hypothetical protein KJ612_00170 [Myxococcota bacterium]|nr:hypothetical protein [Myxococcota bacterium]